MGGGTPPPLPAPLPYLADPMAADALIEEVLAQAMLAYVHAQGSSHRQDDDLLWIRGGEPFASRNHVLRLRMRTDGFEDRVHAVCSIFAPDSLPVTWWVGPPSRPADVGGRLRALGLHEEEPEFGMILDLAAPLPSLELRAGTTLDAVDDPDELEAWLDVMAAGYGWPADGSKHAFYRRLYLRDLAERTVLRGHFLVRDGGTAVAASSLFLAGGHAFVTNIATIPGARGRGLGTLATLATLRRARQLGYHAAVLTASVDGRGLYQRLGFREYGVLERYVADASVLDARPGG